MDRDDHSLSLVSDSAAPSSLTLHRAAVDFSKLTDRARVWFENVKWACLNIQADLKRGSKKRPACEIWRRQLSEQRGFEISAERLRKLFDAWFKQGDTALVNDRLCGRPAKRLIPHSVIAAFWAIYLDMKDKASMQAAWRRLMHKFITGEPVAKGYTWHTLFMRLHPADDLPAQCPWSIQRPPPGWTQSNFSQLPKPDLVTRALALRGIGAAKALLAKHAGVNIAWDSLRVGECYMIDDHDLDFRCLVGGQLVRLRLIVLREVRTRRTLAHVVRPRLKEEDGTERSITRRDVAHLLAGWLYHFGIPRDYECHLHCENAAAAVSTELEEMLLRVTGGRLKIDRTALYKGVVQYGGHSQSGGTPTGKAIIESGFRLLDIELAHVRGATGRNYLHKPEEHQGRITATQQILRRINSLPASSQNELAELVQEGDLKLPFPSIWEAHDELALAIQRMDARTWHDMEGFLKVQEFRTSPDSGIYYPLNRELVPLLTTEAQAAVRDFLALPETFQNRFLGWGRRRSESPAECWLRLHPQVKWAQISEAALFELMLDCTTVTWPGHGSVKCEIAGEKVEFRGQLHDVAPGSKIRLRLNADNPFAAWAQDDLGRVLGTLQKVERVGYHDAQTMRERVEFKAVALAHATQAVRTLEMQNSDAVKNITDSAHLAALLSNLETETARPKASATIQSPSSAKLLQTATATDAPTHDDDAAWDAIYGG